MSSKGAKGLSQMSKALRDANQQGTFTLARPARTVVPPARLGMVRYDNDEQDEALAEALGDLSGDEEPQAGSKRSRGCGKPGKCPRCSDEHDNVNKSTGKLTKYCLECLKKALWANVRNGLSRTTQLDPQFVLDNIDEVVAEAKKNARATLDARAEAAAAAAAQAQADAEAQAQAQAEARAKAEAEAQAARESTAAALAAAQARRAEADAVRAAADAAYRAAVEAEHEAALAAAAA